jgi:hypothetical protein
MDRPTLRGSPEFGAPVSHRSLEFKGWPGGDSLPRGDISPLFLSLPFFFSLMKGPTTPHSDGPIIGFDGNRTYADFDPLDFTLVVMQVMTEFLL